LRTGASEGDRARTGLRTGASDGGRTRKGLRTGASEGDRARVRTLPFERVAAMIVGGNSLVRQLRLVALIVIAVGCKGRMAKIEDLRDALVADDPLSVREASAALPACNEVPAAVFAPGKSGPRCLANVANALGSKRGFEPGDHAAAATAAIVLVRDGRGDWLGSAETWLNDLKSGRGAGHDALRLAVARKMADGASAVGRKIDDDGAASAAMKAVVGAIPGACSTYWLVATNAAPPPELSADHSACVQRDLSRREGPGATYGTGTFRALEGALALWRDTERALRIGLAQAAPAVKAMLEKKLVIIEASAQRIEPRKLASAPPAAIYMDSVHEEAGVPFTPRRDAGAADAGTDARAP
jgi:hypothetical protein